MDTISLPISFRYGAFEKIAEGTDDYYAFLLAMAIRIEPGELPLRPSYGCYSPVFGDEEIENLAMTASQFIPEIDVASVQITPSDGGQVDIQMTFAQREV